MVLRFIQPTTPIESGDSFRGPRIELDLFVEDVLRSGVKSQPVAQPAGAPVRSGSVLVAGKTPRQIGVVLDGRWVIALQHVHVACGEQRIGEPRAMRKPGLHFGDDLLQSVSVIAIAGQI